MSHRSGPRDTTPIAPLLSRRNFLTFGMGSLAAGGALCLGLPRFGSVTSGAVNCKQREVSAEAAKILARAAKFLEAAQDTDGAWRSQRYSFFRSGDALTPFVLNSLQLAGVAPTSACHRGDERSAFDFLRAAVNSDGVLGMGEDEASGYPTYATALALRCLAAVEDRGDRELIRRMRKTLLDWQYSEMHGYGVDSLAYGAWGFAAPLASAVVGHVDVSYTRHVLEALAASGGCPRDYAARALVFLRLVQRHPDETRRQPPAMTSSSTGARDTSDVESDQQASTGVPFDGGFYFSPIVLAANKGGTARTTDGNDYFRSYATATGEGALALIASGLPVTDARVVGARQWLERHAGFASPAGIPSSDPNGWADAVFFTHLESRALASAAIGVPGPWREELVTLLAATQRRDGSFSNEKNHLMKEDDPVLATALAVRALSAVVRG